MSASEEWPALREGRLRYQRRTFTRPSSTHHALVQCLQLQSAYTYNDAQITPHLPQSQSTNPQYPQHLYITPHAPHFAPQDYPPHPPQNDSYLATHRPWSHTNPNALDLISYPALNFDQAASPPTQQYPSTSYAHQLTTYTQQTQLTAAQLAALDMASPPTDGTQRYEQQDQRAGPWDGVGYVKSERRE